jgi:hypothetical protein
MSSSPKTDQTRFEPGIESSFEPVGDLMAIAGYAASWKVLNSETKSTGETTDSQADLSELVTKILDHPQMQTQLGNRVYQLMQEDLYRQKERRIG